jgi:hypothetical protein
MAQLRWLRPNSSHQLRCGAKEPVDGALPHQVLFSLALRRNLLLLRLSGLRRVEIDSPRAYARIRPLANA